MLDMRHISASVGLAILIWPSIASALLSASSSGSVVRFDINEDDGRQPPPAGRRRLIGRLDNDQPEQQASPIRYSLLRAPGDLLATQFDVDPTTGLLSCVNASVDRDGLCSSAAACCDIRPVCVIHLRVRAINSDSPDSSRSLRVEIHLRDVNDNAPTFPNAEHRLTLDENAHQGEEIALPAAVDADADRNGIEKYEIIGDTGGHFQLRSLTLNGGRLEPRLLVAKPLDRELTPELRFTLAATDGGAPPLTGQLSVLVRVNDKNDETPQFHLDSLRPPLTVRLPETQPAGPSRPFLMLNATDADSGLNARLRYRLRNQQQAGAGPSSFFVDSASGALSLSRPLDYERQPTHILIVEAVDRDGGFAGGGVAPRTGSVTLTVSVLDVNDEAPVIAVTSPRPDGGLSVDENSQADSLVAWLTVTDADSGVRGVDCHLQGGIADSGFRLLAKPGPAAEQEFELRTTRLLDAEATPSVSLMVVCADRGLPQLTSQSSLRIVVNNLNDNAPTFVLPSGSGPPLRVSAPENQRPDWLVCALNATDADGDAVRFELLESGRAPFRLDERTGRLYATESFDRELVDQYHLRVRAHDLGKPPRSSLPIEVLVAIDDLNDNSPTFRPVDVYEFSVSESAPAGQPLGLLHAEDPDAGPNGQVQYSLAEFAARRRFRLDPHTGQLATATALDREVDGPRHSFTVWAVDRGSPRRTATMQVTVLVTDTNDNPPRFMFPGQPNSTIDSSFRNPAQATVAELQARDPDEGANSELIYSLIGSGGGGRFGVDPISGRLYVARDLGPADAGTYQLRLSVRDRGQPPLSAEIDLRIALLDLPPEKSKQPPLPPPLLPPQPPSMTAGDRGRQNSFSNGGGSAGGGLGRRGLLLIGCLAIPAVILAVVCLALLLLARGRSRLGRRDPAATTADIMADGLDCRDAKPDIRLIVGGGLPMSRFDCPAPAGTLGAGTPGGGYGGKLADFKTGLRHCPTLPLAQIGDQGHRAQTLVRLAGGPDVSNTYYRIPASEEESNYDRGGGGAAGSHVRTAASLGDSASATIDGRRGRRSSCGQQQQQPPAYQTLMQQQQQQQQLIHQSSIQSVSTPVATGRRGVDLSSQKRQFQLVNSSFV